MAKRQSPFRSIASLGAAIDGVPFPAFVVGADRRILEANPPCRRRCDLAGELRGRSCHEAVHGLSEPCSRAGVHCPLEATDGTAPSRKVHFHPSARGGENAEVTALPVTDTDGRLVGGLVVLRPIGTHPLLVGRSPAMLRMLERMVWMADTGGTALIVGEAGSGKGLVARALHDLGARSRGPYVASDGALARGAAAPAGAQARDQVTARLLRSARRGTLYVPEVADLPWSVQLRLLRALREAEGARGRAPGEVPRLTFGSRHGLSELERVLDPGLHERLAANPLRVPPLRSRRQDLPLLVERLLEREPGAHELAPGALAPLESHPFPGNLRELECLVERALLMARNAPVRARHLRPEAFVPPGRRTPAGSEPRTPPTPSAS